eukprot:3444391-Rhodomonas_salina.2
MSSTVSSSRKTANVSDHRSHSKDRPELGSTMMPRSCSRVSRTSLRCRNSLAAASSSPQCSTRIDK